MTKTNIVLLLSVITVLLSVAMVSQDAYAITVTGTTDPTTLINQLLSGGGTGIDPSSISVTVSAQTNGIANSTGTYVNPTNTYGIGDGIVISSGNVSSYNDGPNTQNGFTTNYFSSATASQEALLDPITGGSFDHFDVTQIDVTFDMLPGFDEVFFNIVFGSEEYPEYVGSQFIDGFGLYVNGVNIAEANGSPVNINHPDMQPQPGTELDGILGGSTGDFGDFVHTFNATVGDGSTGNTLTFIVADTSDNVLDTTVFISQLGGSAPTPIMLECGNAIPSNSKLWPPNHKFVDITVMGVTDADGNPANITIDSIFQDEEVYAKGSGKTSPDGKGIGTDTASLRAEKSGKGDGRVYHIDFTADDGNGNTCSGTVNVSVPHDQRGVEAVDQGPLYDSTTP